MKFTSIFSFSVVAIILLHEEIVVGSSDPALGSEDIFVRGAPLVGGTNGIFFDAENNIIAAQVYGRAISKVDPETGEILETLGFNDSVAFPDDVRTTSDGTFLYWTDSFYFQTIMKRGPDNISEPLLPSGSVPNANPVTLSSDETRLFYAQCWDPEPVNGLYEYNLVTNVTTTILQDVPGCASNAMFYWDEALYTPRPYEGRIVKIDLNNNSDNYSISNVTTGWGGAPQALKFDSQGNLYATNAGLGEVALIDYNSSDTENNREIVARFPPGWIDNLAFDQDDRLYVSSTSDGQIVEVLENGDLRTVVGGDFSITIGVAYLNNTIFTVHPGALFGFDSTTGERTMEVRSIPGGVGNFHEPTGVTTWGDDLLLMSLVSGALERYNPDTETLQWTAYFNGPIDALPFQGDVLVTEAQTGNVVRASGTDWSEREIIYTSLGVGFLAGNDNDVYLTHIVNQTIYQIIADGEVLMRPTVVATGFGVPEGILLMPDGETILLVDTGKEALVEVGVFTGEVTILATDLEFFPGIPGLDFGFGNDVAIDDNGAIYVNGDRANVIYKFEGSSADNGTSSSCATVSTKSHVLLGFLVVSSMLFFPG